jgi:hypothetical protein
MLYLVTAVIDGGRYLRLFSGQSIEDVETRARYFWRDNTIASIEVHPTIDVTVPDGWQVP